MPTSRHILDLLTRDELAHLIDQNEINLGGKAKGHMPAASGKRLRPARRRGRADRGDDADPDATSEEAKG